MTRIEPLEMAVTDGADHPHPRSWIDRVSARALEIRAAGCRRDDTYIGEALEHLGRADEKLDRGEMIEAMAWILVSLENTAATITRRLREEAGEA